MQNLNIRLTVDEVNAVINTLGQLPTASGAYPLMVKIKQQAEDELREPTKIEEHLE